MRVQVKPAVFSVSPAIWLVGFSGFKKNQGHDNWAPLPVTDDLPSHSKVKDLCEAIDDVLYLISVFATVECEIQTYSDSEYRMRSEISQYNTVHPRMKYLGKFIVSGCSYLYKGAKA